MTTKTNEVSYEGLLEFMDSKLHRLSSVEDWNNAREEAKAIFPSHLISKLDASGVIKAYNLKTELY
jgi:hypothetical protein